MSIIKLSPRLKSIASYVSEGDSVADIGTDHGYIPVYLAQCGCCSRLLASDINEGPLQRAVDSAQLNGVYEKIEFIRADGLAGVPADKYNTVIIAGMGGETIISIISRAKWLKSEEIKLIIQPQSKIPELSDWLYENGFSVADGNLCQDGGKLYVVYKIVYGTEKMAPSGVFRLIDEAVFDRKDKLLPAYIEALIDKFQKASAGMEKSDVGSEAYIKTADILTALEEKYLEVKEWRQ